MPNGNPALALDTALSDELGALNDERVQLVARLRSVDERIGHVTALLGGADLPPDVRQAIARQAAAWNGVEGLVVHFLSEEPERVWSPLEIIARFAGEGYLFTKSGIRSGIKRAFDRGAILNVDRGKYMFASRD